MHAVVHDAPRVRDAHLANALQTFYVAPATFAWRDPANTLLELAPMASSRQHTEPSLPLSLVSSLANVFDRPVEDDGPGLRRIILPAPPPKGSLSGRVGPVQKRRQRRAAIEASATAAAAHTVQRRHQHQRHHQQLQSSLSSSSTRGRPFTGLSLEPWQPPYNQSEWSVSGESTLTRKVAKVTSPRTATHTVEAPKPPPVSLEPQSNPAKLSYRLRRRRVAAGSSATAASTSTHPFPLSGVAEQKKSLLDALRHLGAATFNDAPLNSFLPSLDLRLPCSRSSTNTHTTAPADAGAREAAATGTAESSRWNALRDQDRWRRRGSRHRPDAVAVHLGDVEAHSFRVAVVAGEASPLQAVVDASPRCLWDGSEFFLVPLEDQRRIPPDALPAHLAKGLRLQQHEEDSRALSGAQTTSLISAQESQTGTEVLGMQMNFLRSAHTFEGMNANADGVWPAEGNAAAAAASAPFSAAGAANVVIDGPVFGRALEGGAMGDSDAAKSVVPCWKRFCTAAALYLALGDAGCCDTAHFPFATVQLCTWGDLVAQPQTRIEMMASCSPSAFHTLQLARHERKMEPVPVAVVFPTSRKGVMRQPLSLTTQPFTDAEVFQLFYLQLIFRAYFDVRFPTLGFRHPGQSEWHLRSDLVAVRSSGSRAVAFEHPLSREAWLRFPAHTRLLTLLSLKGAVIPLFATPTELQETAVMPLFGGGSSLPCIGAVGHAVAQWAATVEISSPAAAMAALVLLFEKMGDHNRATRAELWSASLSRRAGNGTSPLAYLFHCGVASVGAELDRDSSTLNRFFVLPEKRGVSVAHADAFASACRDKEDSADFSATPSNVTRHTQLPCIPRESSVVDTALSSAAGTPHAPALNDVVLDLDASAVGNGCSGTTEPFISTEVASPVMGQSRINAFASTFDVVHLSTLQVPDNGEVEPEASKDVRTSSMTQRPEAAVPADTMATAATSRLLERASQCAAATAPTSPEKSDCGATEAGSPRRVPPEVLKVGENHVSLRETLSELENSGLTAPVQNLSFVGAASPFTKQESLVTRWRYYMQSGNCAIFDGATAGIQLFEFLGRGGSGLVYRGSYGSRRLPVAVKVLIIPDGMTHEQYVRESLTDVAFYVLTNQLNDYSISYNGRAHDFIVSSVAPVGLPIPDAAEARRGRDPATTKLCYLVTDLMDGTIGRFLDARDMDFDPMYDQLLNTPLQEGELFQFLFNQLALKTLFDWRVLDLMLNHQLRGDNIGYRYVGLPQTQAAYLREHPEEAAALALARQYYAGLLYAFQFSTEESVRYLRFPAQSPFSAADANSADGAAAAAFPAQGSDTPLRLICMIDVGQGMQPNVAELVRNAFIGETVVPSCVEDDGFGRFWPLDELYCRNVDVKGQLSEEVVAWGSKLRINSQEDAFHALHDLFFRYYGTYGVEAPTEEELRTYLCLSWTPGNVTELKEAYVYRAE